MGKRRALGTRAADNRFLELMDGRKRPGSHRLALRVASRIFVHFLNQSAVLLEKGEMRKDDEEPKVALKMLLDYSDTYLKLVGYGCDESEDGSLADLFGRKEDQ